MHVISRKALADFWTKHPTARIPLEAWYRIVKTSDFGMFVEVKQAFNSVDYVPPYTVFDIAGNHFRVIVVMHYNRQKLYIRHVFTHAEYDDWNKKQRKKS